MTRTFPSLIVLAAVAACDTPATRNPGMFQPSPYVAEAPLPQIRPLSELVLPPGSDEATVAALTLSAEQTAIRAEALRARAILQSGSVLTLEERARLMAASARWMEP